MPNCRIARSADTDAPSTKRFDVFLSYAGSDRQAVAQIAERLLELRIEPWWDHWSLSPGGLWQDEIVEGLYASEACAVIIGPGGLANWSRREVDVALDRAASDRSFRVFIVLLPGAPELSRRDLAFLRTRSWVDLHGGVADRDGIENLVCAITGTPRNREGSVTPPGACPYRGLERFDEEHAEFFFGRDDDTAMVTEKLKASRFLAVLGPSGSGKSSLLRAGLVPAVRRGRLVGSETWTIAVFTPGPRPTVTLAVQLARLFPGGALQDTLDRLDEDRRTLDLAICQGLADSLPGDRVLLVVDQFEELFTVCADEAARTAFLANLLHAATVPNGRMVAVVGMRADFYHRCAAYPELRALVADWQHLVGPLDAEGMRQAVEEPARRVELEIEAGLVDTILADVGERPGTLPLLEHVLLELWGRRRGSMLTLEAYVATGGLDGALGKRADDIYAGFSSHQQQIARRILLRLIQPGEGAEDTRRQAAMSELVASSQDQPDVDAVVKTLADERLVTVGRDETSGAQVVDLVHEALIRAWPELRAWIDDERDELRAQRHLTEAATEWNRADRRAEDLYSGARVAYWIERSLEGLTDMERDFLTASRAREARDQSAARRRVRLAIAGVLAAVTSVAIVAIVGLVQVSRQRDVASRQRDVARSRELATQSDAQANSDPQLAALLSLASFRLNPSAETSGSLLRRVVQTKGVESFLGSHDKANSVALSPDGLTLASGGGDRVVLWDVTRRSRLGELTGHTASVLAVAFSPDGRTLVSAGFEGQVILWDVGERRQLGTLAGHRELVASAAFSPDGRTLATAGIPDIGKEGEVILWDVAARSQAATLTGRVGTGVAFSPDGHVLATGGRDGDVILWDVAGRTQQVTLTGQRGFVLSLAFSPDGKTLATASVEEEGLIESGQVKLWDLTERRELEGPSSGGRSVVFSPDGRTIAFQSRDKLVLWTVEKRPSGFLHDEVALTGHAALLRDIAFSPDGHTLATVGDDDQVILWDARDQLAPGSRFGDAGGVNNVSFSPDGRTLASLEFDGTRPYKVKLRDRSTGAVVAEVPDPEADGLVFFTPDGRHLALGRSDRRSVVLWNVETRTLDTTLTADNEMNAVAISPDGRTLAAAYDNDTVGLWDIATRTQATVLSADTGGVGGVAFSPDNRLLASAGLDNSVTVWDVEKRTKVATLAGHTDDVTTVAFSPDGSTLASAGFDSRVILWDVATRTRGATLSAEGLIAGLAFSPDGRMLATEESLEGIGVWDVAQRTLLGHLNSLGATSLSDFSPDAHTLASVGTHGIVLWQVDTAAWQRRLCDIVGRDLSAQEWALYLPGQSHPSLCG